MMKAASVAVEAVAETAQSMAGEAPRPPCPDPGERRAERSSFPTQPYLTAAGAAPLAASAAAAVIPGRGRSASKRPSGCDCAASELLGSSQ